MEEHFSVMFTPWFGKPSSNTIEKAEEAFRKLHPAFTDYIFTGTRKIRHSEFSVCLLNSEKKDLQQ